jgi:1-acyl-sn-glycerol-3-phosphate acyltransferase
MIRIMIRFPLIIAIMTAFLFLGAIIRNLFSERQSERLIRLLAAMTSRAALFVLGVKLESTTASKLRHLSGSLVVSNHLSYLDVLVYASLSKLAFVTSVEIRDTPVLGWVSKMAGCKFVERRSRDNRDKEISNLRNSMLAGQSIIVFPEATSTDGRTVKPFKLSMFGSVEGTDIQVIPCAIRYDINGNHPMDRISLDSVHWYGSMKFFPHMLRLCTLKGITARVEVLPSHSAMKLQTRNELAAACHSDILNCYQSFMVPTKNRANILRRQIPDIA